MHRDSRRGFMVRGMGAVAGAGVLAAWPARGEAFWQAPADGKAAALMDKAIGFLRGRQAEDGSWSGERKEPGITALVVTGLLRSKRIPPADPMIVKALDYLQRTFESQASGETIPHANYTTAVSLMAFQEANQGGKYDQIIKNGQEFLKEKQWDQGEGKSADDPFYGGAGYGGARGSRPDLSNTVFMMEALRETGLPADDPALQKAIVFVSRCQNLKSEFNDQPWAGLVNDGGFIYTTANGGTSVAGKNDDGGLRSYASMTYAGLRSMIYAGLSKDDPRVKAARDYIAKNYTLEENPGLGQRGLYYYYQVFAKALRTLGDNEFVDSAGKAHDWRADLLEALAKRQGENGSWVNSTDGFMEGDANLVTAYGLLALSALKPKN